QVRGRVLDALGTPVPAVAVGVEGGSEVLATSDAAGGFDFELDRGGRRIVSKSIDWITLRFSQVDSQEPDRVHLVIVAAPITVAGLVVDPSGRPIAGATVAARFPIAAFATFPFALDSTGVVAPSAKTSPDGSFVLERIPSLARASLHTSSAGWADDERPLPTETTLHLVIEMREFVVTAARLGGVVVHADGSPAAGALVHLAEEQAKTDERGDFRLAIDSVSEETPLVATLKGFQAAVMPEYGRVIAANDGHPPRVRLVLGPEPLSIAGRVVEADGTPCSGWTVALAQGTAISQSQIPPVTAESLTSGQRIQTSTDKQGAFVVEGLLDRPYLLQAWGRDGRMVRSDPIQAGTRGAELRCEPDAFVERIEGRVVSREGLPLGGIDVSVAIVTFENAIGSTWITVKSVKSAGDGTFVLERVPRRFARLSVDGESVESTTLTLAEIDLAQPIEIAVVRLCRFRFENGSDQEVPGWLEVLDREGRVLSLVTRQAQSMMTSSTATLTDGCSHVLSVSEDAARLVLYKNGEIHSSQPLRLVPGEIVTVRRER
ncbi:MAG: carboxypeptidase-like regulatory domain-containing protein, partial [Planctomycetota bacterium]